MPWFAVLLRLSGVVVTRVQVRYVWYQRKEKGERRFGERGKDIYTAK